MVSVTPMAGGPAAAAYYPVAPAAVMANGAAPAGESVSFSRRWQAQQVAQQQARQQAMQQAQWLQQQQAAQALALQSGPGASGYQVLAENSTAVTAENQLRMGTAGPANAAVAGAYRGDGRSGAGGPVSPGPMAAGQAPPMFRAAGQPLSPSPADAQRSGWQSSGVR
jgi:hypothetical protein